MIRKIALALVLTGAAALPAFAGDTAAQSSASPQEFTAQLSADAHQKELRQIAAGRGYIVTSEFSQSGSGHWVASALKDGKATTVAVKMPPRDLPSMTN